MIVKGENQLVQSEGVRSDKPTIYVPHTWPDIRNAEFEVLQRLAIAAINIGVRLVAIDNDGRPLWANQKSSLDKSQRVNPGASDLMISLHFESPKLIDVYSYYALWQPLQFYHQFGYDQSIEKVITHNDLLSCNSDLADSHAYNVFAGIRPGLLRPIPELFHSPPQPYLEPKISERSRLFYIGINWERINGTKGRHHDLLLKLDAADLVDIYGPQKFLNASPWDGFKTYRGELPFDGRSVVRAQNDSGVCLCLSSAAHKSSGLMSNRLFEGLAAGAAIICDSNSFVERHFSDVVYFIDDNGSDEDLYFQIRTILDDIRSNPQKARARAVEGQRRLAGRFSLEGCLSGLVDGHATRLKNYREKALAPAAVSVVIAYGDDSLSEVEQLLTTAASQTGIDVEALLVCDTAFFSAHSDRLNTLASAAGIRLKAFPAELSTDQPVGAGHPKPVLMGSALEAVLRSIKSDYFCFLAAGETWFKDHLGSIVSAIQRSPGAVAGVSGALLENDVNAKPTARRVSNVRYLLDEYEVLSGRYSDDVGRFVYSRSVLDYLSYDCLALLDGEEANLVRLTACLRGEVADSAMATYVRRESVSSRESASQVPLEQQQQYIRDAFAFDRKWLSRMAAQSATREHVEKVLLPHAPVKWELMGYPRGASLRVAIDTILETNATGAGAKYLVEGFSHAEKAFTWVDGTSGIIEFYCPKVLLEDAVDLDLRLCLMGRPETDTVRPQHCTLLINGMSLAYFALPETKTWLTFRLPPQFRREAGRFRIQLMFDHAEVVLDRDGKVADNRRLSAALFGFELAAIAERPLYEVRAGTRYETTLGQDVVDALLDGFSKPEEQGVWMIGDKARIRFRVHDFRPNMVLVLDLVGRASRKSGDLQRVVVYVNGNEVLDAEIPEQRRSIDVPLGNDIVGEDGVCSVALSFKHAEPVVDELGEVKDPRLLAAKLDALQISPGSSHAIEADKDPVKKVVGSNLLSKLSVASRRDR